MSYVEVQSRPELEIVGEASDGLQAVRIAELLRPDLIVLDIGLPTINGIEAAHRISRVLAKATILYVSQNNDADVVATALGNRAKEYVHKEDAASAVRSTSRRGWDESLSRQYSMSGIQVTILPARGPLIPTPASHIVRAVREMLG